MRGIIILSFHKKPGAFVDREYPAGISKLCNIDATEQNKIYSLHRMRNTKPNFLFVKVKNFQVSSYFTGFDFKEYLGHPNQCVSLVLEQNENPTKWEDILRRLAFELLPKLAQVRGNEIPVTGLSDDPKFQPFDDALKEAFESVVENRIQPLPPGEGDVIEGAGTVIETTASISRSAPIKEVKNLTLTKADVQAAAAAQLSAQSSELDPIKLATQQMENMEKDNLRNEIRNLHQLIQEKDKRIRALEIQLQEASAHFATNETNDQNLQDKISKIKGEYEAILASKEQELDTWRNKVTELNETNFINQDNIRKLTEMTMMQTDDLSNQSKNIIELKKKIKTLEANQSAPISMDANEIGAIRVHLAEVEETLKNTTLELEKKTDQNKELFLKIKKLQNDIDSATNQIEQMKADHKKDQDSFNELLLKKDQELTAALESMKNTALNSATTTNVSAEISAKLAASEAEIAQLKVDLATAENKLKTAPQNVVCDSANESKIKELDAQVKTLQSELIDAKKTIKVQRREIENLQKLAGL